MRLGIDLGGTKTEIVALAPGGAVALRRRAETPKSYTGLLELLAELVAGAEAELGARGSIGMAIPGSESFGTNLIKNANTTYLNGKPLRRDLEQVLGRQVRLANDANCFALSEASDGAARRRRHRVRRDRGHRRGRRRGGRRQGAGRRAWHWRGMGS